MEAELDRRGWHAAVAYEDVASGKKIAGRPGLAAAIDFVGVVDRWEHMVLDVTCFARGLDPRGRSLDRMEELCSDPRSWRSGHAR